MNAKHIFNEKAGVPCSFFQMNILKFEIICMYAEEIFSDGTKCTQNGTI